MLTTVRVQEKGQVTIPRDIRKKLNLKKGDLVTFVVSNEGVVIKSLDLAVNDLLAMVGKILEARGISLENLLKASQEDGGDAVMKKFGLTDEERLMTYQALQLRAQAAVESIRTQAEVSGLDQLSDEDIDKEIQAVRSEAA